MKTYIIQFLLFFFYEKVDEPTKKDSAWASKVRVFFLKIKYGNEKFTAGDTMQ